MNSDPQEVAELVRSGKYYDEAKKWYRALYLGPISERSFFLIIAVLAGLVAFVGLIAFINLMPITERPGILIPTDQPDVERPSVGKIRAKGVPVDTALQEFYAAVYVEQRESYSAEMATAHAKFVAAHSDAATAAQYQALYGVENPRSPANILGATGKRLVTVKSIALQSGEPLVATVKFSTELSGVSTPAKTEWTATLGYHYSPLKITESVDPAIGEKQLLTEDAKFQVVHYEVMQTP